MPPTEQRSEIWQFNLLIRLQSTAPAFSLTVTLLYHPGSLCVPLIIPLRAMGVSWQKPRAVVVPQHLIKWTLC